LPQANPNLEITEASLLDLTDKELEEQVKGCYAVVSCLGHNLSFKGIYGQPRKLVTDAARRLCTAIGKVTGTGKVKYILMNTTGNQNRDLEEPIMLKEKVVVGIIRVLLPPHVDNEQAADYLRVEIGHNHDRIDWVTVRPDTLIDHVEVSEYTLHPSPIRSALFNAGKTSRINVGHFMAELATDDELFESWKGQMPVIYNTDTED